jgi:cellulose synthase/poly-beta-1,6-N-acetylglucosamine synthase-like glycosyltransferase
MPPRVSFLLPVYNEREHLGESLESIARQDYPAEQIEIMLVDGESTDGTPRIVEEFSQRHPEIALRVLANPARNTAVGRNLGLDAASGELVMNFSGHAVADAGMLRVLTAKLAAQPPEVAGVGCAIRSSGSETAVGRVIAAVLRSPLGGRGMDSSFQAAADCDARSLAFCLYRREAIDACGRFDPNFWCGQDAELNLRLARRGYRLRFTPDTHVVHYKRPTLSKLVKQMYRYGVARAAITRKFPGSFRMVFLLPALWVLGWLALAVGSFFSPTIAISTLIAGGLFFLIGAFAALMSGAGPAGLVLGPVGLAILYTSYGLGLLIGLVQPTPHQPEA